MEQCRLALQDASGEPAGMMAAHRACAELFVELQCRAAMLDTDGYDGIEDRSAAIARACAPVYCPSLAMPRPNLCDAEIEEMSDAQIASAWPPLRERALIRDLGPMGARAAIAVDALERVMFVSVSIPIARDIPEPPAAVTTLTVAIRPVGEGFTLSVGTDEPTIEHVVGPTATASEIAALVPPAQGPEGRAVIAADRSTPHRDFIRVVEALRAAGYTRLAINPPD